MLSKAIETVARPWGVRSLQTNSDLQPYAAVLHTLVRCLVLQYGFERAYHLIAVQLFPLFESAHRRGAASVRPAQLVALGDYLYTLDDQESLTTSCLSIAIATQAVLFSVGQEADLLIGVKKQDRKLLGHAWVCLPDGQVIDPGIQGRGLTLLHRFTMRAEVEKWVGDICAFG